MQRVRFTQFFRAALSRAKFKPVRVSRPLARWTNPRSQSGLNWDTGRWWMTGVGGALCLSASTMCVSAEEPSVIIGDGCQGITSCIICVGDTGTGKSTFCRSMVIESHRELFEIGDASDPCTQKPAIGLAKNGRELVVDTRGFSDPKRSDDEIVHQIVAALKQAGVKEIKVLWFVGRLDKKASNITKQGRFISKLTLNKQDRSKFWQQSVAMILKGGDDQGVLTSGNAVPAPVQYAKENEGASQGLAVQVNINLFNKLKPRLQKSYSQQSRDQWIQDGVVRESELADHAEQFILKHLKSTTLKFNNKKCVECGVIDDPRYALENCHSDFSLEHRGEFKEEFDIEEVNRKCGNGLTWGGILVSIPDPTGIIQGFGIGMMAGSQASKEIAHEAYEEGARWDCCSLKKKDGKCKHLTCVNCYCVRGTRNARTDSKCRSKHQWEKL